MIVDEVTAIVSEIEDSNHNATRSIPYACLSRL